ncbi:MAG: PolC-type DNA polymerase III [Clostridia bacterium]|nr:PolC-type DNA polymerase III [Clostridia bacterium]
MKLSEIFNKSQVLIQHKELFDLSEVKNVVLNKELRKAELFLKSSLVIPKSVIFDVAQDIKTTYQLRVVKIFSEYPENLFTKDYFSEILFYIEKKYMHLYYIVKDSEMEILENEIKIHLKGNGVDLLLYNELDKAIENLIYDEFNLKVFVKFISDIKPLSVEEKNKIHIEQQKEILDRIEKMPEVVKEVKKELPPKKSYPSFNKISYAKTDISSLKLESGKVEIEGEVFKIERKDFNNSQKGKITFYVTDYKNSCICQVMDKLEVLDDFMGEFKKGDFLKISGEMIYDKYLRENVLDTKFKNIEPVKKEIKVDTADEKRVELHLHTNMSAIDGINTVDEYVSHIKNIGHRALVITDHGVVQAFPDAYSAAKKAGIKLVYGVEGYLVNDMAQIVKGNQKGSLSGEFVVFDIETTGFSASENKITEIGACKIKNGEIIDRFSSFVNPKVPIPEKISELTGITDEMVKDAPEIDIVLKKFLDFCSGVPLVAHNADFDVSFIKRNAEVLGINYEPTSVDTLSLSRILLPELKKHKLNIVCEHLGVTLNGHHRAVNDAEATSEVFIKFISLLKKRGIENIEDINTSVVDCGGEPSYKGTAYHIIILVKNKTGLKNLYKLVSKSHIDYYYRTPRIPKSELIKHREGLILGSACEAGELYRAVLSGQPHQELINIAEFYDYLEVQPLGNNQYLLENNSVKDKDALIELNKTIIDLGKELSKKVVATGDVHFINEQGALYRSILMSGKKFKDADNQPPLYYRTTKEMMDEFFYLDEDTKYEIVVKNPNDIVDMTDENFEPVPSVKHPPVIEGAAEDIKEMSYKKAYEIYGNPLPEIVEKRMEKELNSIINNGFSVMYLIAEKLVKKSLSDGYLVGSRGSVGSSFVAFLSGITEVNSLCPHYICENCKHSEFIEDGSYSSGCDMPEKVCPHCNTVMKRDGHDIPFETFLGFDGDKEPDIDLNFSGEYQPTAHKYIEELFGEGHVFRAGTIGTIAEKTAFGYVKNYYEERQMIMNNAELERLMSACTGAKATTGQHPGGIIVVPKEDDVYDFTPIQHPANDKESGIITTHFDYHKLHDTLLKLDILGHDDPTMLKMLKDLTGLDPQSISLSDKDTMSLFTSPKALGVTEEEIGSKTGTYGVPEFGTKFARQMLEDIQPKNFASLVKISGLSHGTDVWLNNAQDIVKEKIAPFEETICTRDDIMTYLMLKGLPPKRAFTIMEQVRKGKGLKEEDEAQMREKNVPEWYIESCKKIKYMFPKAHAVAYVTMGFRVAYYKVHYPIEYYCAYYSVRADDFDAGIMTKGKDKIEKSLNEYNKIPKPSAKEKNIITILEICKEMYARGIEFLPVDLYKSDDLNFKVENGKIRPPFTSIKGLGLAAAQNIKAARDEKEFFTKEDFMARAKVGQAVVDMLDNHNCFKDIPDSSQLTFGI